MKVSDLPKEEQDKLIAEANELEIRGIFTSWGVETLKNKIAEARANKAGENNGEKGENGEQNNDSQTEENQEQQNGEQQKNDGENEQDGGKDEQNAGENEQNPPENEQNAENVNNDENQNDESIPDEDSEKEDKDELYPHKSDDVKICHICRSKVIDGKCTGCGFSV